MVRLLLHHHANPNAIIESECRCFRSSSETYGYWLSRPSIWQMALAWGMDGHGFFGSPRPFHWAEMVKAPLDHGASPTATVWWIPTWDILETMQQSPLFVCLYAFVDDSSCYFLPSLLISKGGSLLPDELEFLGHYARSGTCLPKFERRYAWGRFVSKLVRALEKALECSTSIQSSIGFSERGEFQKDWKRVSGAES